MIGIADQPKDNYRNEIRLHTKDITIINLPYSQYGEFGKVEVISNSDSDTLYTLDFFLRFDNYFSEDAVYHVQVNDWIITGYSDQVVLIFYKKGEIIRHLRFEDLKISEDGLTETVSHNIWQSESFIKDNEFYLFTTNNELLIFNIETGAKVSHERNTSSNYFANLKKGSDLYSITFSEDYPEINSYQTNQYKDLDIILSDLAFKHLPDSLNYVWVGAVISNFGSVVLSRIEHYPNRSLLDKKELELLSASIQDVRVTDIYFPKEYPKWAIMIKLEAQ